MMRKKAQQRKNQIARKILDFGWIENVFEKLALLYAPDAPGQPAAAGKLDDKVRRGTGE